MLIEQIKNYVSEGGLHFVIERIAFYGVDFGKFVITTNTDNTYTIFIKKLNEKASEFQWEATHREDKAFLDGELEYLKYEIGRYIDKEESKVNLYKQLL